MEWIKIQTLYDSEKKALKTANIVATTEARLANQQSESQYEVETRLEQVGEQWQIFWRKVFVGNKTGCGGGCESCSDTMPRKNMGKILPFRKPSV
ncbi:MAG: hypothetical protein P4L49_21105 [Desulfosporosinus sp.]|nr:hypothetical protein [Desulfosporosinus sp.]